jgi:hypothetical protein
MGNRARVTVTLPERVVEEIDRREKNRSRFVLMAVERELEHRRREELRRSLANPHEESEVLAESGLREWALGLPEESAADMVDLSGGQPVTWVPGEGWTERHP